MAEPSLSMARAIAAARAVRGTTSPNPPVGAVLVRDGEVIAVGATAPYGGPHAEAAALANCDAHGATLYTTLEPCVAFEGKRTPPCTDAIVEAAVAKVVIAIEDPHAPVHGRGVAALTAAGVLVEVGDGAKAVTELLRPYLKFRERGVPYVIAKFAISLDGKVGAPAAGVRWLTGLAARERAHQDRAWVDAIVVGGGTVVADDPELTARPKGHPAAHQPVRVVLDGRGIIGSDARVLGPGCIVATASREREFRDRVTATGATVLEIEQTADGLVLPQLLRILAQRGIVSLIAEGGPTVLQSLFEGELVDEVHAYVAPRILGDAGLPLFPRGGRFEAVRFTESVVETLFPDVLIRGYTGTWAPAEAWR